MQYVTYKFWFAPADKRRSIQCEGVTLVEVMVAMLLTAMLCAGTYTVGLYARGVSEKNRVAAEARSLARERLEEMIAAGKDNLAMASSTLADSTLHTCASGGSVKREPRLIWHAADGSITQAIGAAYAEVHMDVTYVSPVTHNEMKETISTIIY